jgi:hypothetical protein
LFAVTVVWNGDGKLTVFDKTQGVQNVQRYVCSVTHTPSVFVDAGIVLSKRALPDEYRQLNPSSRSHLYPFSPMISVASFSPHWSLAIPTYTSLSLGWSPTHQVPSVSFHDSVFENLGRACAAVVAISNAATLVRSNWFRTTLQD